MKKLILALALTFISSTVISAPLKIKALVNGEIISSDDFQNRVNLLLMNTGIPYNSQTKDMIHQRVLNSAVEEKLKLQEASKEGIFITDKEIEEQIKRYTQSNNLTPLMLKQANVSHKTIEEQLKSELAWLRVIRKKYYSEGTITQKEINKALESAQKDINIPKYFVAEIFIKKENAKNLSQLVNNLRNDNRFELYAMQFSESPSAANGGNLGWVNSGKLASTLETRLRTMKAGDVSDPILLGEGYYILKLKQRFNPKTDKPTPPTENEIKTLLENQKMETLSKKLLQDIHQKAVIEIR
ncbi:MAG: hypothetical protein E7012_02430 [Alphaproteobacteria bacterium]|nr:hypothetical protein [Alphaproteobacteria bacterium]